MRTQEYLGIVDAPLVSWKRHGLEFNASLGVAPLSISQEPLGLSVLASPLSSIVLFLFAHQLLLLTHSFYSFGLPRP